MLDPTSITIGTIIGNDYEIESLIGQGNMAVVYKARQISLDRPVALKILFDGIDNEDGAIDIFYHEVRAAALLIHPNLVHAIDAGEHNGSLFFVMEYVEGQSLRELMTANSLPDPAHLIKSMSDIAMALDYGVKKHNLSHGDIKPDNIIIKPDGVAKLADFGLAQTKDDSRGTKGIFVTPLYASPESVQGLAQPGDPMPDIYSFGCMLFELFSGAPPFPGTEAEEVCRMHVDLPAPKLEEKVSDLPAELYQLVNAMLQKSPTKRPRNWNVVAERLSSLLEGHKSYRETHKILYIDHTVEHNKAISEASRRYTRPKNKSGRNLIFMLIVIIFTITALSLFIYNQDFIKSNTAYIKVKSKVKEYNSPQSACDHIRRYLIHYGDKAVPEARELLKEYEAKIKTTNNE